MTASPILVTSPTSRSGTTLIQRLITSSDNGICYGENTGGRLHQLCEFAHHELLIIQENEDRLKLVWDNIQNGDFDFWMVALDLPDDYNKHALVGAVTFYRQHHDEATQSANKEVWGAKLPKLHFSEIVKMADLISDLKCIYIYRNAIDVIKSQKTRRWITSKQKLIDACNEWVENTQVIAALKKNDFQNQPEMLHVIRYEDLISNREHVIEGLERFAGIHGVKSEVIDTKINTWFPKSKDDMTPAVTYREPASLTQGEVDIIREICADRMSEIYPKMEISG